MSGYDPKRKHRPPHIARTTRPNGRDKIKRWLRLHWATEGEVGAYSDLFKSPRFCKRFAEYDWPKWLGEQPASEQDWEQFKFQTLPPRYLGPMLPAELKTRSCPQHYYAAPPASSATTQAGIGLDKRVRTSSTSAAQHLRNSATSRMVQRRSISALCCRIYIDRL
jgi:hypothetical protein